VFPLFLAFFVNLPNSSRALERPKHSAFATMFMPIPANVDGIDGTDGVDGQPCTNAINAIEDKVRLLETRNV